jgi:hypothetical protein
MCFIAGSPTRARARYSTLVYSFDNSSSSNLS